ncbi:MULTISPECIES: urea ABC transporter permease subunit UrtB [unclassified Photobacterium]|uniref:urea ABC transporter permease subunit UrtB n=1 Tax=unclassified Photobacterium TaxID=2628852 RepID=UPI001EDDA22C|nr:MULTISPECIES: urea ABC transporter permease subunit UrtB [unclassified Photobacterium]
MMMFITTSSVWASTIDSYSSLVSILTMKKTPPKIKAIEWLANNDNKIRSEKILTAWLNGELYLNKSSKQLVVINDFKTGMSARPIINTKNVIIDNKRDFKKIRVNNKLRKEINIQLALLGLVSENEQQRYQSVLSLLGKLTPERYIKIKTLYETESQSKVKKIALLAIENYQAKHAVGQRQRDAIHQISQYKNPIVFQTLSKLQAQTLAPATALAVQQGLDSYKQQQRLYAGIETIFFGLSLGSVLVLAGIGLAITFGVMGVINMAHGELIMIGAYTTYVMQQLLPHHIAIALLLSIPAAFIVSGLVGIIIERLVIRHLYGRALETLLATFGISLILQQAVRSVFSPLNRSVSTPEFMSGAFSINPMLMITYNRLYILLFCFAVFIALLLVLRKTSLGLQVRAVSQNRSMAKAMGIRSERVDALTFGLGSGVAGIAGVALSQLTNVGPNMGQSYIIDSFMVVVFGGVGNIWGTLVAGLSLGIFNKVLEPWAGAVLAKIFILIFIILFIQKRPKGLFPQRGRAAEG